MNCFKKVILNISLISFFTIGIIQSLFCYSFPLENKNSIERCAIDYNGNEREYFILKPSNFNSNKKYWLLVVVHGGGGNGSTFFMTNSIREEADKQGLECIVVAPSFSNSDFQASRFPQLGEGAFLKAVLKKLHAKYKLQQKILLTGYSRGGQFTHRFAFQNPDMVKACAPFAAGTWTTPDGKLLIESMSEVPDPESFLSSETNKSIVPERLQDLFQQRVAEVAGIKAKTEAKEIPFLIMCGTLDTRYEIAKTFAGKLKSEGFNVKTEWPQTPHGGKEEFRTEFAKYSRNAVAFFLKVTNNLEHPE